MEKKTGIFKDIKLIGKNNPAVAIALLWVSIIPSICSLILVPLAVRNTSFLEQIDFSNALGILLYVFGGMLLMGLALMPTTLFAGLSGFLFGWQAFLWVIVGYSLATLLGYIWGKSLGKDSLDLILEKYPKAKDLIRQKENKVGELIFFVRLSPVIPFALSNLLFALLKSGWKKLVFFGTFGMLPRTTLVFFSGTIASDIYSAIQQDGIGGKGWVFIFLLALSIWGIWSFFYNPIQKQS
ncbi:TVP38/TMEM64 family protein [Belliella marina]|uniref:TVP38/TMEM64 family membrane protein n=1 Tax=Belliella marina TaxID=1644146 RepID=A0ABW4VJ91_9BACT